jgi:xanthine dehydrogenase accessory factor
MDVFEELVRLRNLGQKCALATIVEVRGSIPSYESAKLLVREGKTGRKRGKRVSLN